MSQKIQKHTPFSSPKLIWSLAGGLLLCLLVLLGWQNHKQEERRKALELSANQLLTNQIQNHQDQGLTTQDKFNQDGHPLALLSVLADVSGNPIEGLEALQMERIGIASNDNTIDLIQFQYQTLESPLGGIKDIQLLETTYKADDTDFIAVQEQLELKRFYWQDNGGLFTLETFLSDQEAFINQVTEKLIHSGWSEEEIALSADQISQTAVSLPMTLTNHSLIIPLGANYTPVEMLYSDCYEAINTDLLIGEARVAYDNYLAEKAAEEERLAQEAALRAKGPNPVAVGKVIALTFDDGPDPNTTKQLQQILRQNQVKATFFILGQKVSGNEQLLQELVQEGHQLANHTWSHPNLTKLSATQVQAEVGNTQQAIYNATGVWPTVLRPPYGSSNAAVAQAAGIPIVNWTVDTLDWQSRNTEAILAKVKAHVHPGGIILMHDIHQTSVDAVQSVIDYLKAEGYNFVTINELYGY
ncbi:polysaccharide deacetylase family protein [Streptococcus moroccensis]|uniref:Peptidoglycan/xylan/chitin deacetylase (PgdA/CDA1 family)/type II secretory pathway pseudopilin PulG n=1 Tax=Streptococcus moroccensis TaxID=1451356 RepID=A0ABT9YTM1_9STRE|nr:polysaccharide deacetylase family protein [Streptococcus moroccensis]MDQ0223247.1 peptidoglycan/xylan/chitin deacetylase (PgdA/CDA1 family)/type II secretory pathway pseudopilin PulG [Streptococcus moroccensis]